MGVHRLGESARSSPGWSSSAWVGVGLGDDGVKKPEVGVSAIDFEGRGAEQFLWVPLNRALDFNVEERG